MLPSFIGRVPVGRTGFFSCWGYQHGDVEISKLVVVGTKTLSIVARSSNVRPSVLSTHTNAVGALVELMSYHGFVHVRTGGCRSEPPERSLLIRSVDSLASKRASLAQRFFYLGMKLHETGISKNRS